MKNIIVMPNFQEDLTKTQQPFIDNCRKSWMHWCKKNNCNFLEIERPIISFDQIPPQAQKMWVYDILEHNEIEFDQAAVVDYDTFVLPDCPNFFETSDRKFCAVPDNGFGPGINRIVRLFKDAWYPDSPVVWDNYFNSGFFVFNKTHKQLFTSCIEFYFKNKEQFAILNGADDLNDQTIFNFILHELGYELNILPRSYNVLDWHCGNFFTRYTNEEGKYIDSTIHIKDCVNIFHLTGGNEFRNSASSFLLNTFYANA
jgi:hypothetical protein